MNESRLDKINTAFWVIYILVAIFSGIMQYRYEPHEGYDAKTDELLKSHYEECGTEGMDSCEVPDLWRDKTTGKIYTPDDFLTHRRAEAWRIAPITFAYGLIGCLFAAYRKAVLHRIWTIESMQLLGEEYVQQDFRDQMRKKFFDTLKGALIVDLFISFVVFLVT